MPKLLVVQARPEASANALNPDPIRTQSEKQIGPV
jgi:hypothetical protein